MMINIFNRIAFFLCLIGIVAEIVDTNCFIVSSILPATGSRRVYNLVNDYLVKSQVSDAEPEKNLNLAINWLQTKASKKSSYTTAKKSLEDLRELPNKCGNESYSIILKNNRATGKWFDKLERKRYRNKNPRLQPSRPIDMIVQHYISKHAKNCLPIYQIEYKAKIGKLDILKIQNIKSLALGHMKGRLLNGIGQEPKLKWEPTTSYSLYHDIVRLTAGRSGLWHVLEVKYRPRSKLLYEALWSLAGADPNSKYLKGVEIPGTEFEYHVDTDKLRKLYKRYIKEPCQYYINELGESSSVRAAHLEQNLLIRLNSESRENFFSLFDYNIGVVEYELCRKILDNSFSLFSGLVDRAHQEPVYVPEGRTYSDPLFAAQVIAAIGG